MKTNRMNILRSMDWYPVHCVPCLLPDDCWRYAPALIDNGCMDIRHAGLKEFIVFIEVKNLSLWGLLVFVNSTVKKVKVLTISAQNE